MKERLLTLLGGLIAFAAVALLLAPPARIDPDSGSVPTSVDTGPQGLAALRQWLQQSEIPVISLQQRYPGLMTDTDLPEQGNLLISVLPHRDSARPAETAELQRWVSQGNSILLLTGLADWPAWASGSDRDVFSVPQSLGFEPIAQLASEDDSSGEDEETDNRPILPEKKAQILSPSEALPFLRGVERVNVNWLTTEQANWRLESTGPQRSVLVLLRDEQGEPAFWEARVGQGRLWMSRHAELFNNAMLGKADNAAFAARLLSSALGPGGRVIFDDRHHGMTSVYDPDAFFEDPRLHHTLWFLFALWIVYLLGHTNRFVTPAGGRTIMSLAREVRAVGGFLARRVQPAAVARRLLEHFHNEVRSGLHLPRNGQPAWSTLEGHAGISRDLLRRARSLEQQADAGHSVNLRELVNTLKRIKEKLK